MRNEIEKNQNSKMTPPAPTSDGGKCANACCPTEPRQLADGCDRKGEGETGKSEM